MKGLAIKIASGVLVVALVVVVALAISGVFGSDPDNNDLVANAEASVENIQVFNGVSANQAFYIACKNSITDLSSYVSVKDSEGKSVALAIADKKDELGNIGFLPKSGKWTPGVAYKIRLISSSVAFVDEKYADLNEIIFVVKADDIIECETRDNVVFLSKGDFRVLKNDEHSHTLDIFNLDSKYPDTTVFIYQSKIGEDGVNVEGCDEIITSVAYKIDPNVQSTYDASSRTMTATVVDADVDDVYDTLNIHQSDIGITENTFKLNEQATLDSLYSSDIYLSTVAYLYGEQLASSNFDVGDYGTFKIDYDINAGEPFYATINVTLKFSGFIKSVPGASVTIKLANKLTPTASVNFQKDPKAFDVAINADLETVISVDGAFEYGFDNTNGQGDQKLQQIIDNVCKIVQDSLGTTNGTDKPFIFATWVIPVGSTPIQIVENMGIEVKTNVKAKLSASATNVVSAQFGVAYVDDSVTPYFNVDDEFNFNGVSLTGTWTNKVGLHNEIGISACGIVSINLGVNFGVYLDLAGRLEMDGWSIMNEELNIIPAYYVELGLYTDMNVNGKVWKINIAQQTFLDKKWPLWDVGYKYIPVTKDNVDGFTDETVRLNSSYFYLTSFDAYAIDIQYPDNDASIRTIEWDEFDYSFDEKLLTIKDNKVKVTATAPHEFETQIVVTSKVNKAVSKVITVIKSADQPTADVFEKDFVKGSDGDLMYNVYLNTSKFIGVSLDDNTLIEGVDYTYNDEQLVISNTILESLTYGEHEILFESSKGYLSLSVNVLSDKNIVPEDGYTAVFDKAVPQNACIDMPLYGSAISSVSLDNGVWSYSQRDEKLIINANYLMNSNGEAFTISFTNGESAMITIKVVDNRQAVLRTVSYDYNLDSNAALPLDIELYDNEISAIYLGSKNITEHLNGKSISKDAFVGVPQGSIKGKLYIGSKQYDFTVNVSANNALIVNAKTAKFDKANANDVVFIADIPQNAVLSATIDGVKCESFSQSPNALIIDKDYFINKESGTYTFTVSGASNIVELKVEVINSALPSVNDDTVISLNKGDISSYTFKWNLQDTSLNSIIVEGLDESNYSVSRLGLTLNVNSLPYGLNEFTVYTAVNSFDFKVNVGGAIKWIQKTYNFNLTDNETLKLYVDMADKEFSEVIVMNKGDEVELMNTQLRYNNGVVTLSNDYTYNLSADKYDLILRSTDGNEVGGAVLNIIGKLPEFDSSKVSYGTKDAPFVIYTKKQFLSMIDSINALLSSYNTDGVYFALGADIDLGNETINPIGTEKNHFKGEFNGNGYTIANFKVNDVNDGYTGLFAYNDGTVKNLRLANVTVDVQKHGSVGIGLVVGYNQGTVQNISVSGGIINAVSKSWQDVMNAYFDIGGIVGYNNGKIIKANAEVEINAEVKGLKVIGITIGGRKSYINVGAIVGYFANGNISGCSVTATINAVSHNDSVTSNGWYGNTDLNESDLSSAVRRCNVYTK